MQLSGAARRSSAKTRSTRPSRLAATGRCLSGCARHVPRMCKYSGLYLQTVDPLVQTSRTAPFPPATLCEGSKARGPTPRYVGAQKKKAKEADAGPSHWSAESSTPRCLWRPPATLHPSIPAARPSSCLSTRDVSCQPLLGSPLDPDELRFLVPGPGAGPLFSFCPSARPLCPPSRRLGGATLGDFRRSLSLQSLLLLLLRRAARPLDGPERGGKEYEPPGQQGSQDSNKLE